MILPEIVSAGIFNSDLARKNTKISKKRKTTMFEIELPIDSTGTSYMDEHFIQIKNNIIICAKPGQTRHTKFPYKCHFIHLIVKEGSLYELLTNLPDFIEVDNPKKYLTIYEKIEKYYDTPYENDEIILHSLELELIYNLSCDAKKQLGRRNVSNNFHVIENAVKYIKENLTENLSLDSIAARFNLSPVYFHNIFKLAVGKTLRDYIEEQRIKKSIMLLQTTDDSLTRIAYECGFSSQSYFSFVFKRRMKMTPREYVKNIYNKYEI